MAGGMIGVCIEYSNGVWFEEYSDEMSQTTNLNSGRN